MRGLLANRHVERHNDEARLADVPHSTMHAGAESGGGLTTMSVFDGTVSPTRTGNFVSGEIDAINGSGAEASGFVVTNHELEQVARYWFHQHLENEFCCFIFQQSG